METEMYQISLLISGLLSYCFSSPKVVVKIEVQDRLDPRGLVYTDIKYIEKSVPAVHYAQGMTIEQVAYQQGQQDMLNFIKNNVIGRRLDG